MNKNEAETEAAVGVVVVMVSHSIFSSFRAWGWNTLSDRTNSPNSITPFRFTSKSWNTCKNSKAAAIKMNSEETFQTYEVPSIFQIVLLHLLTKGTICDSINQPTALAAERQRCYPISKKVLYFAVSE
jgi:hypothetical protein